MSRMLIEELRRTANNHSGEYVALRLQDAASALEKKDAAIRLVRSIIVEGAETGFNCFNGDWATRLYQSQSETHDALGD